jgi:hypothetical protein
MPRNPNSSKISPMLENALNHSSVRAMAPLAAGTMAARRGTRLPPTTGTQSGNTSPHRWTNPSVRRASPTRSALIQSTCTVPALGKL